MKNVSKNMQSTNVDKVSAAGGQTAPAGAVWPPAAGGREPFNLSPPNPEVSANKARRKFTAKYKLKILDKADACTEPGLIGTLLRSEGLYSSHLSTWRRQRKKGLLLAMAPKKRGCRKKKKNPLADELTRLENENRQLKEKLRKAEIVIDIQKKISDLLTIDQNLIHNGRNS